jgi:tRNA-Thr(GGU) m(6)t(6)A37 methyltransferase TsaA
VRVSVTRISEIPGYKRFRITDRLSDMAELTFIGRIHSSLKSLADCPLQESEDAPMATVEIFPVFVEAMKDIKAGDELILFTWLDRADRSVLTTHPRNDLEAPLTGIFSTRSPDRPNPVGLHFVKVVSVNDENRFTVSGLEVLDQTPIVDVKPDLKR